MVTTWLGPLAISGVLVLGSFAYADEADQSGHPQQERATDIEDTRQSNASEPTEKPPILPPPAAPRSPK